MRIAGLFVALLAAVTVAAEDAVPQYGGELNVGSIHVTISALSWAPEDWTWKSNHDAGHIREQLIAGDLQKSSRLGGPYDFIAEAFLPRGSQRGELAESWHFEDPLTVVFKLRKGIMFPARAGVMQARELVADDVVFTFDLIRNSPRYINTYFDHVERVEARDDHTVVFQFNHFNAEWDYRFGYGYYSGIVPREMADVDRRDWRTVTGTGPFTLSSYIQGNSQTYSRRDDYWDTWRAAGQNWQLPFVDKVHYRIIKDEATYITALRTGRLDMLEGMRWLVVDHLKETTPELKWNRWLATGGTFLVMRLDRKPFDDIRVRRALNLAVNQPEIVERFYGGHAELMAYPQHPGFGDYFQPLEEMPESVQELFSYNPEKARQLLAEAGYPDGFEFDVQVCSCSSNHMDLIPLLESYLREVGVRINIQPLEYGSFLSAMTSRTHGPGYLMGSGHTNPTTTLRKSFMTGQTWNPSQYSNPEVDADIQRMLGQRDEAERVAISRALTIRMLDEAPYIWLPTTYVHSAWWPWVKNYGGELRAGAVRPGPIYARIWIDREMKRRMGFE